MKNSLQRSINNLKPDLFFILSQSRSIQNLA